MRRTSRQTPSANWPLSLLGAIRVEQVNLQRPAKFPASTSDNEQIPGGGSLARDVVATPQPPIGVHRLGAHCFGELRIRVVSDPGPRAPGTSYGTLYARTRVLVIDRIWFKLVQTTNPKIV